jgi:hypothetical protein
LNNFCVRITKKRERGELVMLSGNEEFGENQLKTLEIPGIDKGDDDVLSLYEEAVKIGDGDGGVDPYNNNSPCETRYHRCPATGSEILGYMAIMESIDDLLQF